MRCVCGMPILKSGCVVCDTPLASHNRRKSTAVLRGEEVASLPIARQEKQKMASCIHLGPEIGTADCGCSGKRTVYHCFHFEQMCMPITTNKPWTSISNAQGVVWRGNPQDIHVCRGCPNRTATG